MYKKKKDLLGIIAATAIGSSLSTNALPGSLYWDAPTQRMNGQEMQPEESDFYLIYQNIDNNGWSLFDVVQQEEATYESGRDFKLDIPNDPAGSAIEYGVLVVDTNGIKSGMAIAKLANSDYSPAPPETSTPNYELNPYNVDLTRNPVTTMGNFNSSPIKGALNIDSTNSLGDQGCFYQIPINNFTTNSYTSLEYLVTSETETDIVFSLKSGSNWYNVNTKLSQGVNGGVIPFNNFTYKHSSNNTSSLQDSNLKNNNLREYLRLNQGRSIEISVSGLGISCATADITINELTFKK